MLNEQTTPFIVRSSPSLSIRLPRDANNAIYLVHSLSIKSNKSIFIRRNWWFNYPRSWFSTFRTVTLCPFLDMQLMRVDKPFADLLNLGQSKLRLVNIRHRTRLSDLRELNIRVRKTDSWFSKFLRKNIQSVNKMDVKCICWVSS